MDKNLISQSLRAAKVGDAREILGWFNSAKQIRYWGGPGLAFPIELEDFVTRIKLTELASYVLVNLVGERLAFGQFYSRLSRHHFGRLAVAPKYRGKGFGRILLTLLMHEAKQKQQASGQSLFVMQDNAVAIALYQSLGFSFAEYPQEMPGGMSDCLYMIRDESSESKHG